MADIQDVERMTLELGVLGSVLAAPEVFDRVAYLRPADFRFPNNRSLWRIFQFLRARNCLTADAAMKEHGARSRGEMTPEQAREWVETLHTSVLHGAHVQHWAARLRPPPAEFDPALGGPKSRLLDDAMKSLCGGDMDLSGGPWIIAWLDSASPKTYDLIKVRHYPSWNDDAQAFWDSLRDDEQVRSARRYRVEPKAEA